MPNRAWPFASGQDRVVLHHERDNLGDNVVLEPASFAVDPERVGGEDPIETSIRPIWSRDDGARNLARGHRVVERLEIAGIEKIMLVYVRTVKEDD